MINKQAAESFLKSHVFFAAKHKDKRSDFRRRNSKAFCFCLKLP